MTTIYNHANKIIIKITSVVHVETYILNDNNTIVVIPFNRINLTRGQQSLAKWRKNKSTR